MAPHLTPEELDFINLKSQSGKTATEIHKMLANKRGQKGIAMPHVIHISKVVKGQRPRSASTLLGLGCVEAVSVVARLVYRHVGRNCSGASAAGQNRHQRAWLILAKVSHDVTVA